MVRLNISTASLTRRIRSQLLMQNFFIQKTLLILSIQKGEIASLSGIQDDPRHFQISVPVQPGNSGGALVDERGNVIGIVSAKLDAGAALAASGALPENVNYAVKSSLLLSFLESVPAVSAKLKAPVTADRKFEDVVMSAQDAAVLVLVY